MRLDEVPKTMRAVVYRGAKDLQLEQVPVPAVKSDEILVRVAACGVCPTDIKKIHYGTLPPPRIFGHETSGTVARIGNRVRGIRVGERVALHHHVPCLHCHACAHKAFAQCPQYKKTGITAGFEPAGGGYADYVRVMSFVLPGVVKIPAKSTFFEGAMLEPVNTVLKGVEMLPVLPGDRVMVVGQGPIGLMFTKLLALRGLSVIATDLLDSRLALAKKFGASWALRPDATDFPEKIAKLTGGHGLDAAVIAVPSNQAVEVAQKLVRGAGSILLFAHTKRGDMHPIDLATICVDEKRWLGSYSSDFTLQRAVAKLVFSRQINVLDLIRDVFPLEQTAQAVDLAAHPTEKSLKVMVQVAPTARPER